MSIKRLLIPAVLVTALVLPASAGALARDFTGSVDPSGAIQFTYKQKPNTRKVVNLIFTDLPITCSDGDHLADADTTGFVFKVSQGHFAATLVNDPNNPTAFLRVVGDFTNRFHRAHGTVRLHGNNVATHDGARNGCDTGVLDWSAHS